MKLRLLFFLALCFLFISLPPALSSQDIKTKTVLKAAFESGIVNLHRFFGDGILYRGILRVQSKLVFSKSYLQLRTRFTKEYFDVSNALKTFNQQGDLIYAKYFKKSYFQIHASFNNHSNSLDSLGNQDINQWQLSGMFNKGLSETFSLVVKDIYLSRNFSIFNIDYSKNRILFSIMCQWPDNKSISLGFYHDDLYLTDPDTTDSKDLLGFQIDYQYNHLIILNLIYNLGFAPGKEYNNHQLNVIAGKYLSRKWSLFLSFFYTWINDDRNHLELFNNVEVFNNIYVKLGFDLFKDTNIYLKGILEDHKLVNYSEKITSRQIVIGLQQKF